MKNRIVYLIAGLMLLTSLMAAQEIYEEDGHFRVELTETFDIAAGGKLVIDRAHGDVEVKTWNKDKVEIREFVRLDVYTRQEAEEVLDRIRSEYVVTKSRLVLENQGWRGSVNRDFEITLPKNFDVDIYVNEGDISVVDLIGDIVLESQKGDITAIQIEGEVELNSAGGDLEADRIKGDLNLNTAGGDIDVKDVEGRVRANTAGGDIDIVKATSHIIINTAGGEINVAEIDGDVDANTAGGDIDVEVCAGDVQLNTAGGDIVCEDIGGELIARTSGGDIEGENLRGYVDLQTHGGDIDLQAVQAGVRAISHAGEINVEITGTDFDKIKEVNLRTSYGDIHLDLPRKIPASITAVIKKEDGCWDCRHEIFSDFPLSTQGTRDKKRSIRMQGDINGGGIPVSLETSNGDIFLEEGR